MLKQRIITAMVLAPLALFGVFGLPFSSFVFLMDAVILLAAWEWANLAGFQKLGAKLVYVCLVAVVVGLCHYQHQNIDVFYVFSLAVAFWFVALFWVYRFPRVSSWGPVLVRGMIGFIVLLPCWFAFVEMKSVEQGDQLILLLLLLVWGADVGAYFAGKRFGRTKLAPSVSPGKTREGLYGGLVACLAVAVIYSFIAGVASVSIFPLVIMALLTGLISVLGDLFESMLKRHRGIKDSSQLLPGHGGVLDRIDSITAASPLFILGMQYWVFV
ncbi:phosphatidate cytidylyltransferase [Neptuniibacter sp. 2_MG-2023]|uniref:phosphatidate cytidylyltransferase n=1 Tax=Neptuniibacter sp. 2_MG-2023 TaxID=3062671 RepID=UPI0026E31BCC|nr:phosphatidate cytidylyltransferase [Neptuniibacter sp. 2_MG-2023]MDO6514730.1 phosphatidate cytidylyltransferase [Neptuniibacter sp. 2_MG-2023]